MNHSKSMPKSNIRKYLTAIFLSVITFVFLFYSLGYVLFKLPKFDFLYNFFPILLLVFESLAINFYCRKLSRQNLMMTFVSSATISILSIAFGLLLFRSISFSIALFFEHVLFVICTVVLQMISKEKRSKRKTKKKMPFEK